MSTLISNPKVNDESLRGHVEPMPPPPALALAHEVWRANRDGEHRRGQGGIGEAYSPRRKARCPNPDQGIVGTALRSAQARC